MLGLATTIPYELKETMPLFELAPLKLKMKKPGPKLLMSATNAMLVQCGT